MKISIITPTFNSQSFILSNLLSVKKQSFKNFEHIIIDKNSNDKTIEIVKKNGINLQIISENDQGIYDAFNKGIQLAKGDIISIINSDDYIADEKILEEVVSIFKNKNVDIVYGNVKYVKRDNLNKVVRYWKSSEFVTNRFKKGWSPPHPTFFVKKEIYKKYGNFKVNLGNASDFELMFRFLEIHKIKSYFLDRTMVIMRTGGASNKNVYEIIKQNMVLLKILKINKNIFMIIQFCISKFFNRLKQFYNNG